MLKSWSSTQMRPRKRPWPASFFGVTIEHQAADVADELTARVAEIIMLAIKIVAIGEDHPGKAERLVLKLKFLVKPPSRRFSMLSAFSLLLCR